MQISLMSLWETGRQLYDRLAFLPALEAAFPKSEVYLVGGGVRDRLIGRPTKDDDFLVRGVEAEALGRFLRCYGKVSYVGKTFGVYKLVPQGMEGEEAIDIALPRTEQSFSGTGGYRDFHIQSDPALPIEKDLERRDFTINAIAADLKYRRLIDPFSGQADLEAGILRAVGSPRDRFAEDTSRILRGLRLACQLDLQFEHATWQAIQQGRAAINALREDDQFVVPRETLAKELIKALVAHPVRAFDLWDTSGAFLEIIPELLEMKGCPQPLAYHTEGDVWIHTRLALQALSSPEFETEFAAPYDAEVVLAVLFHDIGKPRTLQTPQRDGVDRIRFNNHDRVGARMVHHIAERLKLSVFTKGSRYAVHIDTLAWLVEKHLLLVQGQVDEMRASTLEKHFLHAERPGRKLMQLIFCDGLGSLPPPGVPQLRSYRKLKLRLAEITAKGEPSVGAPPPLLSGRDVMEILHISPGPAVGAHLLAIREEQLQGNITHRDEAVSFLMRNRKV